MPLTTANAVICGAGLAGISMAYHLAVRHGMAQVLLVDERPPLSLTSDKSTEGYRNWWPGLSQASPVWPGIDDAMVRLMDRSIDLLEELARASGNAFRLNRRGYLYVTADPARAEVLRREAEAIATLGAGPLRCHTGGHMGQAPDEARVEAEPHPEPHPAPGAAAPASAAPHLAMPQGQARAAAAPYMPALPEGFEDQPAGADWITDRRLLAEQFPYLSQEIVAALHVRRAGWLSAQQLGMYLLEQARSHGVQLLRARLEGIERQGGRVTGVRLAAAEGEMLVSAPLLVNAAGPLCGEVARLLDVELPAFAELHAKVVFHDTRQAVPRDAPLLIWNDPQRLDWAAEERAAWEESPETRWLLEELPAGAHTRPDGPLDGDSVMALWGYHTPPAALRWPPAYDPLCAEVTLRGLVAMLPGLRPYLARLPRPVVDGGYYLKTRENRPLIGPLPAAGGAYLIAALSGFGVMACCAAGELLAQHIMGGPLPGYAPAFRLERYEDSAYLALLAAQADSGQL